MDRAIKKISDLTLRRNDAAPVSSDDIDTDLDGLIDVIRLAEQDIEDDNVSVGDLVDSVGQVSLLPLILLPAIALTTPLSGIPLFSSSMGVIIFLVSAQMLVDRSNVWLPIRVLNLEAKANRVRNALAWAKPVANWLDRHAQPRLTVLAEKPFVLVPQLLCLISGLILPILEFVPFTSSLVGMAVSLLAFGMLRRDGIVLLIAFVPYVAVVWLVATAIS